MAGHFVLPITRQYVCVDVTTLGNMESDLSAQFSSYKKSIVIACRVMLNADSGCLWGCKLVIIVVTQRWDDKQRATNCYMLAVPLGRRSLCLCCLYLGANDTTQSLWETLIGLLQKCCCHVDVWDVLQRSKAVANCRLHQTVKVACSSV